MQIAGQGTHRQTRVRCGDPLQKPFLLGLDIKNDLVRFNGDERVAFGHTLAIFMVPLQQGGLFHRQAQLGDGDLVFHASISRTLATMRSASGCRNFSKPFPKGWGVNGGVRRRTGKSRW